MNAKAEVIDRDLKARKQALEDELLRVEKQLDERRRAREGAGWLCWRCTEMAWAARRIEPTEHIYHEPRDCMNDSPT